MRTLSKSSLIPAGGVPLLTTLKLATPGDCKPRPNEGTSSGPESIFGGEHDAPEQGACVYSMVPPNL